MKECQNSWCQTQFVVTEDDRAMLDKLSTIIEGIKYPLPEPTQCPSCRQQRRMLHGNQYFLYQRKCDATGEDLVSNYHPDSPFTVYKQSYYYSDDWDPSKHGREYDFNKPFFQQFQDLLSDVPRPALHTAWDQDENSEYTNYAGLNKDCYLIFDSDENRDVYYSYSANKGVDCIDCYRIHGCEQSYQLTDCVRCYNSQYLQDCENCSDSAFLKNCVGCKNCFMSWNLRNKEYHVFNQPVSKEEYEKFIEGLKSTKNVNTYIQKFKEHIQNIPQKYIHGVQNENVVGDYIVESKNAYMCFDGLHLWDCRYTYQAFGDNKDSMDLTEVGLGAEFNYECYTSGYNARNCKFTRHCLQQVHDLEYCIHCPHSSYLFGCIGMSRKQYAILNKQYSKEDWYALIPKIIEHMKSTGEYGEMFPEELSDFAYNKSHAMQFFPLSKEEVLSRGWKWRDDDQKEYQPATYSPPDRVDEAEDSVCNETLACEHCGRNYRIIKQELKFYRQKGIPLPKSCFYCRHERRHKLRNPRQLWSRNCNQCQVEISTSYSPERPEEVLCEQCYQNEVY
jgi:hypothetical protein